jgi:MFS family permease
VSSAAVPSDAPPVDGALPPLYTRDFWVACAVHFTGAMSLAMFILVPLFVREVGGGEATIGLVLGVGTAASVALRPLVGLALDRFGRRPVLLAGGVLNTLSYLPFLAVGAVDVWLYVWCTVHAVVWGALFAAYFTYAADLTPAARRAEGIAVFGVAGMSANGIAPVLGEAIIAEAGFPAFFLVASGFALLSLTLTPLVPKRPRAVSAAATVTPVAPGDLLRAARQPGLPVVLVATVLLGVAINAAFFFVAPYTRDLGIARAGAFFTAYAATSVVIRLFGRRILDVLGPHRVSVPAFAVFALGLGGLAFLPAPGLLVLCGIACGAGHGTLFPVLNALAITRAPAHLQGTVVSLHTAALDLGAVVGTPLCGLVAELLGWRTMFLLMAVASLAGLVCMATDPRRRRAATA